MNLKSLLILPIILILAQSANAYSIAKIYTMLATYNVSNSTINALTYSNVTFNNNTYISFYQSGNPYFLINVTNNAYQFILNASDIAKILHDSILTNSFNAANFTNLYNMMLNYQASSAKTLNACYYTVGLTRETCTLSNYCQSCQTIPICDQYMNKYGGPNSIFGQGIMKFASQYDWLNASFNGFFLNVTSATAETSPTNLDGISRTFLNISNLTHTIYQNALFTQLSNTTNAQIQSCLYYPVPTSAPWYCVATGYCENLNYNYSLLNKISARISVIKAMPFTDAQILTVAENVSKVENTYVVPVLTSQKTTEANGILNTTFKNFSTFQTNAQTLLAHTYNSTLAYRFGLVNNSYNLLKSSSILSLDLAAFNTTAQAQLANATLIYNELNASYSSVYNVALNNTAMFIKAQLNKGRLSYSEASTAFTLYPLDVQVMSNIADAPALLVKLDALSNTAKGAYYSSIPIFSITEITRFFDSFFVNSLAMHLDMPYNSIVTLAPLLGGLFSLIIGIIVFAAIFIYYMKLKTKKRIVMNKKTQKNWMRMFMIIWVIIIAYVLVTIFFAYNANGHALTTSLSGAVSSSPSVIIIMNGTSTPNMYNCASQISSTVSSLGKTPNIVTLNGNICSSGNATVSRDQCLNLYAQMNVPVIMLTNGAGSNMKLYSFYGTTLYATGNSTFMNACYPTLLIR